MLVTQPRRLSFAHVEHIVAKRLQWIITKLDFFKTLPQPHKRSSGEYYNLRASALTLAQERLAFFNASYGFKVGKVSIRNQRTRWGSCSRKGNICFNYRIVQLAPELVGYLIVHELCHVAEMNHSQKFWKLVERVIPHYKALRKKLKQQSL
ncbi:M48 family metallopeptidase [Candidatus Uhrbacteria bacterium]|nr:M48 family metallopeptidase [Candidatus Uhrbacteria bacterium]